MLRRPARVLLAAVVSLFPALPAQAEVCTDRPGGQYASNHTVCVSSVLKPQGANTYGPENLMGESAAAWCEGSPGGGQGEYIRIAYAEPVTFKTLLIGNGYAKSRRTFRTNLRARTVRIETGDGLSFSTRVKDTDEVQRIRLARVVKTNVVRLTIVDVYGTDKQEDLCMHFFAPDFEEMDRDNQ